MEYLKKLFDSVLEILGVIFYGIILLIAISFICVVVAQILMIIMNAIKSLL